MRDRGRARATAEYKDGGLGSFWMAPRPVVGGSGGAYGEYQSGSGDLISDARGGSLTANSRQ